MRYESLGSLIRSEREKQGWDQAELATRMLVKQQSVSRWENGSSRPKQDDVLKLVDLFSGDVDLWLAKADYEIDEPDASLAPYLPLHNLSPENFELFCRDLVKGLNPEADVQRYGTQGHTQDGIDLFAKKNTFVQDYQCKRHRQFGPADIENAISITTFVANHHYLLLSRSASPLARKTIKNHIDWTLWDREDIAREVRSLAKDVSIRLVDTYFPGWRKRFLGVEEPSPWLTPEEFYRPLADRLKLFSHGWSFVGRQKEQSLFKEFESQDINSVLLISGRGGIGKSRLLKAWSEGVGKAVVVRFLSPGTDIRPEDFEKLPTGPSYLVIDDAHERSDLGVMLGSISRLRPKTKIIVSTRPYGLAHIKSDLTNSGFMYDSNKVMNLGNLTMEDATTLAEEILKDSKINGDVSYAKRIAEVTKDCPFATVVGSRLVGTGEIKPELLNNAKQFQDELLSRFYDVITGKIGGPDAQSFRDLLELIATIQPLNPADSKFQKSAKQLLSRPFDKIIRDISTLEDAGVILRRGTRIRVVPDLLADYIRALTSYDSNAKRPTGYADRVFNIVQDELATNLLVNISQLDWRLSADGAQHSLLNEIWTNLKSQFKKAKLYQRATILEALGKVSYYQPAEALNFVKLALDEPTDEVESDLKGLRSSYNVVTEKIPEILRYVAYNGDYLIEALDILKTLAENDARATNPHPNHPIRVLKDLASIEPGKPGVYNEVVATHAIGWLQHSSSGKFSPFDVLDVLLETEGHQSETQGFTITMRPFKVRPEAVASIREKIVTTAFDVINTRPLNEAMRALKTLSAALHYPSGILGQSITDADRAAWDPGILKVIEGLESIVTNLKLDPFLSVEIRRDVSWHATWGSEKTKLAAKKVLAAIPTSIDYEITRAAVDSWGWTFEKEDGSSVHSEALLDEWRKKLVEKLITKYKNDFPSLITILEERITTLRKAEMSRHSDAGPFLAAIMESSLEFTSLLGDYLVTTPSSPLVDWFGAVISVMAKQDRKASLDLAQNALKRNEKRLTQCVGRSLGWGLYGLEVLPEEIEVIKELSISLDPWVRRNIVRTVKRFPVQNKPAALQILLGIDLTDSKETADEVLGEFEEKYGAFKTEDLSYEQLQQLLGQLTNCPSIDDYHITLFLSKVSSSHPLLVMKLLMDRVEHKEQNPKEEEYSPLPYSWRGDERLRFSETVGYEEILRKIRDWASEPTSGWMRFHYGADLFKAASAGFDKTTLSVLEEWIMSSDQAHIEAATSFLSEANRNFVWDNQDFVVRILDKAKSFGNTCYRRVCSSLHTSLLQGGKSGTAGQPFPEDIEQREKSFEIMSKLSAGSPAQKFYKSLNDEAKIEIERHSFDSLDS